MVLLANLVDLLGPVDFRSIVLGILGLVLYSEDQFIPLKIVFLWENWIHFEQNQPFQVLINRRLPC